MSENLRVSIVQTSLSWENKVANLSKFEKLIWSQPSVQSDLIILPEMFSTGFTMRPAGFAEDMSGQTVYWMKQLAIKTEAAIGGSMIIIDRGFYYNRFVLVEPNGLITYYDKRHLFTLAGEQTYYQKGAQILTWKYKGWRIRPLICYDLRFPVWSRNTDQYDLLIYVANWPSKRAHAWKSLLPARAIENQCYTIGVNRIGSDPNVDSYDGDSTILDFEGRTLVTAANSEGIFATDLSFQTLHQFRENLNFLADRDSFIIT